MHLVCDATNTGFSVYLGPARGEDGVNAVDDAIVSIYINRVLGAASEVVLEADNSIVYVGLAELTAVGEGLAVQGPHRAGDGAVRNLALDDVVLDLIRSEVDALKRRVHRREDGVWATGAENIAEASSFSCAHEGSEVVIALDVVLLVAQLDTLGSPADVRSLQVRCGGEQVSVQSHGALYTCAEVGRGKRLSADEEAESENNASEHDD